MEIVKAGFRGMSRAMRHEKEFVESNFGALAPV
jgi:hypothetical protein